MKRILLLCLSVLMLLSACEGRKSPALMPESYLTGWYVDNGVVYIVCHVFVMCENAAQITMDAYSAEDVGALLKTGQLTAYNEDMTSTVFDLHKGRNEFIAVFVGVYGTSEEKADYHIPDNIKVREKTNAAG